MIQAAPHQSLLVDWRGPIQRPGGLGGASREYVKALRGAGVHVTARSGHKLPAGQESGSKAERILVYHYLPNQLDLDLARRRYARVVLNTVWETTKIPRQWRKAINGFDAVIVPSSHNVRAMRESGIAVPVYKVPHGVDTRRFRPSHPPSFIPGSEGRFVFLSVFSFQHRKNPEALLRAYWEEFNEQDPVLLVIKTNGWAGEVRRSISNYRSSLRLPHRPAPIHLISGQISDSKLRGLYTAANAFVLPTRGEGVGMPFMEALASGIPVIATRWGGQSDFLNDGNSFAVPYRLARPADTMKRSRAISRTFSHLFAQPDQLWAEADLNGLKRQMRSASLNPGLCRIKGRQGRLDMTGCSWVRAGRELRIVLEAVMRGRKRREGMLLPKLSRHLPLEDRSLKEMSGRTVPGHPSKVLLLGGS
ncbi:glycosyltransferase [Paenibacillus pasadenensis]|uniref:glycosyltransferase n=1 Tax=Paenibacillus pasadenensis TaxID=217090 RepID=UPI00203B7550|nr:glycosyltransferase [Paenibacillus pasadenensis]MCM3747765.1 glycosyltransferase [Paenibacillus pasadenensis]